MDLNIASTSSDFLNNSTSTNTMKTTTGHSSSYGGVNSSLHRQTLHVNHNNLGGHSFGFQAIDLCLPIEESKKILNKPKQSPRQKVQLDRNASFLTDGFHLVKI